jgi:hypothetical protein
MKEVVDHVEGRTALPMRYIEGPEDVDVRAIRSKLGLSQAESSRHSPWARARSRNGSKGRPESAVRAYLTVIDRNAEIRSRFLSRGCGIGMTGRADLHAYWWAEGPG